VYVTPHASFCVVPHVAALHGFAGLQHEKSGMHTCAAVQWQVGGQAAHWYDFPHRSFCVVPHVASVHGFLGVQHESSGIHT
jgi:hypothetical protein